MEWLKRQSEERQSLVIKDGLREIEGLKLCEGWISVSSQCREVVGKSGSHVAEHSENSSVGELDVIDLKHQWDELLNGLWHTKVSKGGKISRIPSCLAIDEAN